MNTLAEDIGCYYGVHFGCLCVTRDSNCRRCAERLTNAVKYGLQVAASTIDTQRAENTR